MRLCFKVGDNGDFVFLSGTAIDGVLNHAQNGSILIKIIWYVLNTPVLPQPKPKPDYILVKIVP